MHAVTPNQGINQSAQKRRLVRYWVPAALRASELKMWSFISLRGLVDFRDLRSTIKRVVD